MLSHHSLYRLSKLFGKISSASNKLQVVCSRKAYDLKELKTKYLDQIDILSSMEMEFIPGIVVDFDKIKAQYNLDYLIGSVHLVGKSPDTLWFIDGKSIEPYDEGLKNYFGGDIKKGVRAYFDQENEMIETEKFDIIG